MKRKAGNIQVIPRGEEQMQEFYKFPAFVNKGRGFTSYITNMPRKKLSNVCR